MSNSKYFNMRKFHNKVKFFLIADAKKRIQLSRPIFKHNEPYTVFDVSVGRFGDMHSYKNSGISFIYGIDPDEKSIEEAKKRKSEILDKTDTHAVLKVDTITNEIIKIPSISLFDIVVCNFSLHYFFKTEEMLNNALYHISMYLKKGQYFIGTTIGGFNVDDLGDSDNDDYYLKLNYSKEDYKNKNFGLEYIFKLKDNNDSGIYSEDLPEYIVKIPFLIKKAKEYNLKLVDITNFNKINWNRINFSKSEKIISSLYFKFIFIKQ